MGFRNAGGTLRNPGIERRIRPWAELNAKSLSRWRRSARTPHWVPNTPSRLTPPEAGPGLARGPQPELARGQELVQELVRAPVRGLAQVRVRGPVLELARVPVPVPAPRV